jgi:hypothetical protein
MKSFAVSRWMLLPLFVVGVFVVEMASTQAGEAGYGTITGQFVLEGDAPEVELLVKKGDSAAKDPSVCAAQNVFSDELVIDPETKGIANIFVYIPYKTARKLTIHPELKSSKEKEVVFTQKGCRFIPHALIVRTDQTLVVKSDDACSHNTNASFFRNTGFNFILGANESGGRDVKLQQPERYPMPVRCDIHPWMSARWLVLDHPYAALTDQQGRFTIEKLPVGEHEFMVNHERAGNINRTYKVSVKEGLNELETVPVPVDRFAKQQ